ncbi:uncharacterized protein LOC143459291 [Clavelina lepadiformis]|uniref:uncharacterized protein LOC143459291 n=1 Tax=Clavelina lepadiformis TaxID=159417 RepID=UPI004043422A
MKILPCIAFVLAGWLSLETDACMSVLTHPQVQYCQADYVIKILVGKSREVWMHEDGSFEYVNRLVEEEKEINEVEAGSKGEGSEEVPEGVRPEPIISNEQPAAILRPEVIPVHLDENPSLDMEGVEASEEEALNDPPSEDEAGDAPETGREIHWNGISTSHHSRQRGRKEVDLGITIGNNRKDRKPKILPAEVVNDDPASLSSSSNGASFNEDVIRTAAARRGGYISMYFGPNGAMPGTMEHFEGVNGKPLGVRSEHAAPEPRHREKRSPGRRPEKRVRFPGRALPGGLFVPQGAPKQNEANPGFLMNQYSITILKVFKGEVSNETQYLYTPPHGGLCKMHLKKKTPYLIMGSFESYGLHVSQADFKLELGSLDLIQLHHLTSNMKHRFSKGCHDCYIKVCTYGCDGEVPLSNQCIWHDQYTLLHQNAIQFSCIHKRKHDKDVCEWYNALDPDMTPADL